MIPLHPNPRIVLQFAKKAFLFLPETFNFAIEEEHCFNSSCSIAYQRDERRLEIWFENRDLDMSITFTKITAPYATSMESGQRTTSLATILKTKKIGADFFSLQPYRTKDPSVSLSAYSKLVNEHCMDILLGMTWIDETEEPFEVKIWKTLGF